MSGPQRQCSGEPTCRLPNDNLLGSRQVCSRTPDSRPVGSPTTICWGADMSGLQRRCSIGTRLPIYSASPPRHVRSQLTAARLSVGHRNDWTGRGQYSYEAPRASVFPFQKCVNSVSGFANSVFYRFRLAKFRFLPFQISNTTGSSAARNLPSISRFVQPRHHTAGVLVVVKKSCFVLFVCVWYVIKERKLCFRLVVFLLFYDA